MTTAERLVVAQRQLIDRILRGEFTTGDGKFVWIKYLDARHGLLVTEAALRQQESGK